MLLVTGGLLAAVQALDEAKMRLGNARLAFRERIQDAVPPPLPTRRTSGDPPEMPTGATSTPEAVDGG
jgi:hypothetical protein